MIDRLEIRNFKSIAGTELEFGRVNLFIGVNRRSLGDVDALVVRDRLPELALQVQPAVREAGRRIRHEPRLGGIQHLYVRLEGRQEDRLALSDEFRHAVADELVPAVR